MKRLFVSLRVVLLFLFLNPQTGQAEPACPDPVQYKLPDGSFITITLKGDEHVSWATSPDGYTLLTNGEGYYEYARKNIDGNLVLSGIRAHNPEERSAQETVLLEQTPQNLRYSAGQISVMREILDMSSSLRSAAQTAASMPTTGTVRAPLILVGFKDKPFTIEPEAFNLLMNQPNYTANGTITGSVHDYYYDNSYGQLDYHVDVYGPYTLSQNIAYYDYKSNGNKFTLMPTEAIQMADADGCNFAQYDGDGNGIVDGLHIIFAGYSQAAGAPQGESIWSHSAGINVTRDGKKIDRYSCSPELRGTSGTNIAHIGTIAHELGHVFGLPDLYDSDYADSGGESVHIGAWDVMATGGQNDGGRTPANFSAYCKDVLGWKPAIELNTPSDVLLPDPTLEDLTYRINTTTANEYFLLENRQKTGWDAYIPAAGMLIYHVDNAYSGWNNNKVNTNPAHRGLYVKQAGGGSGSNSSTRTSDPYPSGGNTAFTDASTPNSKSWAGQNTAKPVTDIVHNTADRTVSFAFMGGSDGKFILENLFTEDFEAAAAAWTLANGAQTNQWLIGSTIAHSGSKSAYISFNGTAHSYTLTEASTVHLYRDVAFPALPSGHFRLEFDWKAKGEYPNGQEVDYMEVRLIDRDVTPEAGVALSTGTLLGRFFGADWQHAEIILPDDLAATSKRLVFTWINNETGGGPPPVAIDNIVLNRVQPLEFASVSFLKKHNDTQPSTVAFAGIDDTWSASAPDWITLNPAEGSISNHSAQFTFTCTENNENSVREGLITVNVNDKTVDLKVTQVGIAPSGLEAVYDNATQSVQLTWNPLASEPVESGETTLKWHNGVAGVAVGFVPRDYVEAAIRFTPEDLTPYHGTNIRALEIYAGMLGTDMAVNIRQDGQLVYTQPVAGLQLNSFVRIDLEKSVPIDITKELLVGFSYRQRSGTANNTVFSRDTGPVVAGKNVHSFDQGVTFTSYGTSNWNIALFVGHDATPAYHVYRDGERIAEMLNDAVFEDLHPPLNTTVCYTVSAAYDGKAALESVASDAACVFMEKTGQENISRNSKPLFDVYTKGNIPVVCNYAEYPAIVSIYDISGQLLHTAAIEAGETKSLEVKLMRGVYLSRVSYKGSDNPVEIFIKNLMVR
ncbi:MAG: M6 family metalloprotease domain-containing protein [Dysgonamonadaceae bacterium]|jgi:M6 family metalloprotease-like protein|nr:M6 family metalloprotease domain-containing protein [Dysgonamonadaceae bacterium]